VSAPETGLCATRWCEERQDHAGSHRAYLGELQLSQDASVHVTVEAHQDYPATRHLVLSLALARTYLSLGFDWTAVDELASMLLDARKRFATGGTSS
jgi:hypothetical protein